MYLLLIQGSLNLAEQIFVHSLSHILVYLGTVFVPVKKKSVNIFVYMEKGKNSFLKMFINLADFFFFFAQLLLVEKINKS